MSVMGTKTGTKTWYENGQGPTDLKSDPQQAQMTDAQKQKLGAEDVGAVLNKISDPNWVDPSKKVHGTGSNQMDKDAFFKLMLAQLKNQDPTNPLKNHEMAAQLAQFSSLEQMTNVNKTLTEMKAGNKPIEQFQSLNLIGKKVAGDSSKISRTEVDTEHEFKFKLAQDVSQANVKVTNAKGEVIREFKFNELKAGENQVTWNGQDEKGKKAAAGQYAFKVDAVNAQGQKIQVKTDFEGVVSGVSFSAEGPVLQVGKQSLRLKDVRQFSDPSLMSNDQNSKDITRLDLKKKDPSQQTSVKEETKSEAEQKAMGSSSEDLLENVSMEGDLLNKVKAAMEKNAAKPNGATSEANKGSQAQAPTAPATSEVK